MDNNTRSRTRRVRTDGKVTTPKGGRPREVVDEAKLQQLAQVGSPMGDMALVLGVSVDTLERRYAEVIKRAQAAGRAALLSSMTKAALMAGNMTAMIWVSKQPIGRGLGLGFKDAAEVDHTSGGQPLQLASVVIQPVAPLKQG